MKLTRFADIPKFTQWGSWECNFQFDEAVAWVDKHGVDLSPDFQRGHVWTEEQQTAWIEFFLRGGKTSRVIYFNSPSWQGWEKKRDYDEFVIVDGLQRYTSIKRFVAGEIKAFGSYIHEFTDHMRGTQSVLLNVNDLQTRHEVLRWYLEMNTGGTPHTEPELDSVRALLREETRRRLKGKA